MPTRKLVVDLAAASVNWSLPDTGEAAILAAVPDEWSVHVVRAATVSDGDGATRPSDEARAAVADAEAYFGFGLAPALLAAAPALRWVHSAAAGVTSLLTPALRSRQVELTNSAGVMAVPIAEHVLGGLLYLLRSLDVAVAQQREARWDKAAFVGAQARMREIGECRVLIVGAGGIGCAIAERLTLLGARCTAIRRRPELGAPRGFARAVGPGALDVELENADVIVLAAPLTEQTRDLLTAARLDRLPPDAIVVNVARGALLDEAALVERVRDGRLRGAVLDVFRSEPLAAASPLWQLPQIVITPHVAAVSPARFWEREIALFLDNWHRWAAGEPLRNVVDQTAGY